MAEEFNKIMVFDNITYLLKESGMKIGELEVAAGVSPGYISRTSKDSNTKPGIDFICKTANALNISIDTLLSVNLAGLTPTEKYLAQFLYKLKKDTDAEKLEWNIETAESLNKQLLDIRGNSDNPLFSSETFHEDNGGPYQDEVVRAVFVSNSFGINTTIDRDCYNLRLKNGVTLYLMSIIMTEYESADVGHYTAIEAWMNEPQHAPKFLCSNDPRTPLSQSLNDLYYAVAEFSRHPQIRHNLRYIIDAYMNGDIKDDKTDDDLPF